MDIDDWILDRLPVCDAKSFYDDLNSLDQSKLRGIDWIFISGVKNAAFGNHSVISEILTSDQHYPNLSAPKRKLLAWVIENPQPPKRKHKIAHQRLAHAVDTAAMLHAWCGFGKTEAVKRAACDYAEFFTKSNDSEDIVDSVSSSIFRAIGSNGKFHEYFESRVAELSSAIENDN